MNSTGASCAENGAGSHRPPHHKGEPMRMSVRFVVGLILLLVSFGHAMESVVPTPAHIELCEDPVMPTHVYAANGDRDFERFAESWLEEVQDITWTRAFYRWEEPVPFAIFVDLLHGPAGGLVEIQIHDHHGNPTWSTIHPVPRRMGDGGILFREVLVVPIPLFALETAFPRTSVYSIRAAAFPTHGASDACAFSASTSVMVDPTYPSVFP